jgi:membrane-associated protease RseP (regulator of RpoE activity)
MYDEREIDEYYNRLESLIAGALAAIVGEVEFDSWVDVSRVAVVVPSSYPGTEIAVPVAKSDWRPSMIACVAANSRSLKPYIVVPGKIVKVELHELGFPPESCCVVHQENGFVTSQLFNDWLKKVLIPDVMIQRER